MKFLVLDTSTEFGGVGFFENKKKLALHTWKRQKSHSETVTESIQTCLKLAQISINDINAIIVNEGPGSFTGLRISANIAKTISYCNKIPIYPINSLHALALNAINDPSLKSPTTLLCMINAFKNMVFWSQFEFLNGQLKTLTPIVANDFQHLESIILQPCLCIGNGFNVYEKHWTTSFKNLLIRNSTYSDYPFIDHIGLWASQNFSSIKTKDWKSFVPLYIRPSAAEEKLKAGLLKPVYNC